jgi:hypothetical protein
MVAQTAKSEQWTGYGPAGFGAPGRLGEISSRRNGFNIARSFAENHAEDRQNTIQRPFGMRRDRHVRRASGTQMSLSKSLVSEQIVRSSAHRRWHRD